MKLMSQFDVDWCAVKEHFAENDQQIPLCCCNQEKTLVVEVRVAKQFENNCDAGCNSMFWVIFIVDIQ